MATKFQSGSIHLELTVSPMLSGMPTAEVVKKGCSVVSHLNVVVTRADTVKCPVSMIPGDPS